MRYSWTRKHDARVSPYAGAHVVDLDAPLHASRARGCLRNPHSRRLSSLQHVQCPQRGICSFTAKRLFCSFSSSFLYAQIAYRSKWGELWKGGGEKPPRRRAKIKRPCRPVTRLRETCPRARMQRIVPAGHSVRSGVASSPRGPQTFLKKSLILNDQTGFAASFFLKKIKQRQSQKV